VPGAEVGPGGGWLSLEARHTRLTLAGTEKFTERAKQHRVDAIAACHRILGRRRDVSKFIAAYLVEANLGRPGAGVIPSYACLPRQKRNW